MKTQPVSYLMLLFATVTITSFAIADVADNPVPGNGALQIEPNLTELEWSSVNASDASFTVYFGKTDLPALAGTVNETRYPIASNLDPNTVYYWRVDTVTGSMTETGPVWIFTTGGKAVNPTPQDNATNVSTRPVLSWQGDRQNTYIENYDVFISKTDPPSFAGTVTGTSYPIGADLDPNAVYYWKVIAKRGGEEIVPDQPTWSFKTGQLVGHWPFDGDLKDIVGGNDGTAIDPNFAAGIIQDGLSAEFYGEDPVFVPTAGVASNSSWTISCWEFSNPNAGGNGIWETMVGCGAGKDGWEVFEFGRLDVKRYVLGFANGSYKYTPNDNSYARGEWHFHVISYDAAAKTVSWYINGMLANSYPNHTEVLDTVLSIGNVRGLSQPFTGKIDDLKLYNRPLSAGQVLDEYVNGVGGAPILPVPASGTRNVAWDLVLDWVASASATSHTIEIGKMADLSDATLITLGADVSSFDVVAGLGYKLDLNTEYFWRITSTLPDKIAAGPIWFFQVRNLVGDVNTDLVVDLGDVKEIAGVWLEDSSDYPPAEYVYLDQEKWSRDPNFPVDPILSDYAAPWPADTTWGWGEMTLKKTPSPADENHNPGSQTIVWRYNKSWIADGQSGSHGTDVGITLYLPDHVDFTKFDKFGFWVYQENCTGSADIRIDDQGGVAGGGYSQKIYRDWYDIGSYNGQWHKYEWDIPANSGAKDVGRIRFYRGQSSSSVATEEFSDFFLIKNDTTVKLCLKENVVYPEDFNRDCRVDLLDLALMAENWMLDASN